MRHNAFHTIPHLEILKIVAFSKMMVCTHLTYNYKKPIIVWLSVEQSIPFSPSVTEHMAIINMVHKSLKQMHGNVSYSLEFISVYGWIWITNDIIILPSTSTCTFNNVLPVVLPIKHRQIKSIFCDILIAYYIPWATYWVDTLHTYTCFIYILFTCKYSVE